MKSLCGLFIGLLLLACSFGQITSRYTRTPTTSYVLSSFGVDDGGFARLKLFHSTDAVHFWESVPSYYGTFTRDPSIIWLGGKYRIVHSTITGTDNFAYTESSDGITWAAPTSVSTSDVSGARSWAPEWVRNEDGTPYVDGDGYPQVAISITSDSNWNACPPCFSMYIYRPTNAAYTTWSSATALTITGIGTENPIDPFIQRKANTFYLWWKAQSLGNAADTGYSIGYATGGSNLTDEYTLTKNGGGGSANWNWAGFGTLQEGPALLNMTGTWRLYMDDYQNSFSLGYLYYSESTDDWATWTARTAIRAQGQAKHGTIWPLQ